MQIAKFLNNFEFIYVTLYWWKVYIIDVRLIHSTFYCFRLHKLSIHCVYCLLAWFISSLTYVQLRFHVVSSLRNRFLGCESAFQSTYPMIILEYICLLIQSFVCRFGSSLCHYFCLNDNMMLMILQVGGGLILIPPDRKWSHPFALLY